MWLIYSSFFKSKIFENIFRKRKSQKCRHLFCIFIKISYPKQILKKYIHYIAKSIGSPLLMNRFDYFSNFYEYKS